jgi:hypothetical protein
MVWQPIAQTADLIQVAGGALYNLGSNDPWQPHYLSDIGKAAESGTLTTGQQFETAFGAVPVVGQGIAGWNLGTAISNGDWNSVAYQAGGLTGGLLLAKGTSYAGDTVGTLRSVSSPSFLDTSFLEAPQGDWSASGVQSTIDATTSAGSDWIKPAGWRLPATNGEWLGTPGNSGWLSYNDDVNAVTGGQPIPFNNGYPDFSQWSQGSFTFSNLTGTNSDFSLVYQAFADENGLASQTAGQNLLRDLELTPHHVEDGQTIQLIPTPLHSNVPHIGGASILRNGN